MTSSQAGIVGFLLSIAIVAIILPAVHKLKGRDEWYHEGWQDCLKAYKDFGMSSDDEVVLKHLKSALRAYVDIKGYRQKGDVKAITGIGNFDELRHVTWQICERKRKKCSK